MLIWFHKFDAISNRKTDTNNHGPFSSDNIGMNYDYPEASYERRKEIIEEHKNYQMGLLWFVANDPRIPEETQSRMQEWGLTRDEFTDNGNWPHQLYIREARRYEIAYGSLVPKKNECTNLLVPVCVSSSHIAFGSIRMEPVFIILGQSAAVAASIAIDRDLAVQDLPYQELSSILVENGQILNY